MAEEEVVALNVDHHHKRKLEVFDVPPPDSTSELDGERKDNDEGENGDEEPSKRPRVDEMPDALAGENGHKSDDNNGHAVENFGTEIAVDNTESTVVTQDGGKGAKEAVSEEMNEAQSAAENVPKVDAQDDNSEEKDVQMPFSETVLPENAEEAAGDEVHELATEGAEQGDAASGQYHHDSGTRSMSRKIEIPNNKVGVLIGKSGDTIKYLQINSGAKIQITRDADSDPHSTTRPVELMGTLESLNKAEKLIKDVIAEADAGGSPSLVARGFTAAMTAGSLEIEIPVPSDKVGLIIGKGGETIRSLQTKSGARIQLIPQNLAGDQSKEKKVKVTGDKKQVEMARELIKEIMNQLPGRPTQFSSNSYSQQGYRPRGPDGGPQWATRGPAQPMAYDYQQRGLPYPSQNQQYPPPSYGNYPPQGPPRGSFGSGWEHRPPAHGPPPHSVGYGYYRQGGGHAANASVSAPHSAHMPGHPSGPSMAPPPHSQANYNYGQPRGADYPQPTPYSQTAPPTQTYGHGYGEPKYDTQVPVQQPYGGQGYAQQQQGYAPQQQYNRPPPYSMPSQRAPPQGYAPPTANQPADAPYQAPVSAAQPYGQNVPPHQQYPQAPYGSAPVANDGYTQPQPAAAGYAQQVGQPIAPYGQQPVGYVQASAPMTGYSQYPSAAQPVYGDQSTAAATSASTYGYQGQADPTTYAAATGQAYGAAPPAQQGYAQAVPAQPSYDQSAAAPQPAGYVNAPAGPPVAYGKTLSPQPQPGYPQYDASQQVYSAPPR